MELLKFFGNGREEGREGERGLEEEGGLETEEGWNNLHFHRFGKRNGGNKWVMLLICVI